MLLGLPGLRPILHLGRLPRFFWRSSHGRRGRACAAPSPLGGRGLGRLSWALWGALRCCFAFLVWAKLCCWQVFFRGLGWAGGWRERQALALGGGIKGTLQGAARRGEHGEALAARSSPSLCCVCVCAVCCRGPKGPCSLLPLCAGAHRAPVCPPRAPLPLRVSSLSLSLSFLVFPSRGFVWCVHACTCVCIWTGFSV